METRNKVLFIALLILSVLVLLSQNFWTQGEYVRDFLDWMEYVTVADETVYVSWQDSFFQFLSPLTYLPTMAGGVGILGAFALLGSVRASKLLNLIACILAILAYGLFILFPALFGLIMGSAILIPNLPGAYLCLVSGILLLICSYSIKSSKVEGHAMENKQYYAIGGEAPTPSPATVKAPTIKCPKCGALLQGDQPFCENCGQYL